MSVTQEQSTLARIRERGYWRVVIRPTSFDEKHIPCYADVFPIVAKHSVRFRGWDYPHVDPGQPPLRGRDWVGQECDWEDEVETWRLYQSGQFIHYFAIAGEWRDRSAIVWPAEPGWTPGERLYYVTSIFSFLEIFEFAARLAQSPAGSPRMHVAVDLRNVNGRRLIAEDSDVVLHGDYRSDMESWTHVWEGTQPDLIANLVNWLHWLHASFPCDSG